MDEYYLELADDENIPQKSIVGEFKSTENQNFKCFIILDDYTLTSHNMREMLVSYDMIDGELVYFIYLTNEMLKKLQTRKKHFLFLLFHELGHIHLKHFPSKVSQEQLRQTRIDAIRKGSVSTEEIEADAFAIDYFGKSAAINALDIMYRERLAFNKLLNNPESEQNLLALKEIENRKRIIKNLT